MKRLTILAVMLAVLASCTKDAEYASARLDFAVTGNTMTKVTTEEIRSAVTDAVENLSVRIYYAKAGGGKGSFCNAGDVVTLPVGDVYINLEYYGECRQNDDVLFYTEPYFYADTTVAFHSYYSDVIVRAHFKCAMVVVDPSETEDIYLDGTPLNLADYGDFKAFYVYADVPGATTQLRVHAKSQTDFTERDVTINPAELEWGRWYMLSPTGITSDDAGMGFIIDGFHEGGRI